MTTRTPLMAGNWKMNKDHLEAVDLVQRLAWALTDANHDAAKVEVAVIPPFTALRSVQTIVDGDNLDLAYGGQDCSQHASGAYTGEISAGMLRALGCTFVVLGHSERREYHAESDALVGAKAAAALGEGLTPIVCVGEGLDIREAGTHVAHVVDQVKGAYADLDKDAALRTVIAYEPVWAIGTGKVATPEDAQEVCAAVRETLASLYDQATADAVRVLYGGSVKPDNVADIMAKPDVDGALVGGASLKAEDFSTLVMNTEKNL